MMFEITDYDKIKDYKNMPAVLELKKMTISNDTFRTSVWTGEHLQLTVMSIDPGDDVGTELHEDTDQMLYIMQGRAKVFFGESKDELKPVCYADGGDGILVPAKTWHNILNSGFGKLKILSVYAPPHHKAGTIQKTKPNE